MATGSVRLITGHRRVGALAKAQRCRDLVDQRKSFSGNEAQRRRIVTTPSADVRDRFVCVESAPNAFESFKCLVGLAVASGAAEPGVHASAATREAEMALPRASNSGIVQNGSST